MWKTDEDALGSGWIRLVARRIDSNDGKSVDTEKRRKFSGAGVAVLARKGRNMVRTCYDTVAINVNEEMIDILARMSPRETDEEDEANGC